MPVNSPPVDAGSKDESLLGVKSLVQSTTCGVPTSSGNDYDRLTFHVALGEAGFASLGISVTKVTRNHKDIGIFIKSVMVGGMAAKARNLTRFL